MKSRMRRAATFAGVTLAGGLVALSLPAPAWAAPGDAAASGIVVDLAAEVDGTPVVGLDFVAGTVTAPPGGGTDSESLVGVDGNGLGAEVVAAAVDVAATRGAAESSAESTVTAAELFLFETSVLSATEASATVSCPAVGAQTADTTLTGLEVFGGAVVVDANTPPVVVAGAVTVAGLTDAELQVSLTRIETVTDDGATAAAVVAELLLTGNIGPLAVEIPVGTVTLALATCERPAPLAATGITPDSGPESGGQTVTITGTGFVPGGTTVTFDGAEATDVEVSDDGTSLTAVTPPGEVGPADVVVTTVAGSTAPLDYTYLADGGGAVVDDLDPTSGPTTGGTTVTITGSGFTGASGVTFDGDPGTGFTVDAAGETITVVTPAHAAGPVDVEIVFPAGSVAAGTFTYVAAGPVVDSVDPPSAPSDGGTVVTVGGSGFVPGETTVTICDVTIPADEVSVNADGTSLTFVTPPCPAGVTELVVTTPAGSSAPVAFRYFDPALPNTSSPVWPLLVTGTALVLGGGWLLALTTRGRLREVAG